MALPSTLVRTASSGKNSHEGTCLRAAAWKTKSTPRLARSTDVVVAHVADVEADPVVAELPAHVVLLGLVAAEHPDLADAAVEEAADHRLCRRNPCRR